MDPVYIGEVIRYEYLRVLTEDILGQYQIAFLIYINRFMVPQQLFLRINMDGMLLVSRCML